MSDYLVKNYTYENIVFTKPRKYGEYLVSRIKYLKDSEKQDLLVQFPKMTLLSDFVVGSKNTTLEFTDSRYSKQTVEFIKGLEDFIVGHIVSNSEEWFGKQIPEISVKRMYTSCLIDPVDSDHFNTMNITLKNNKGHLDMELVDKKNNVMDIDDFKQGNLIECLGKMKYLIFSKESSFLTWEVCTAKLHKKVAKVPKFGFVEDPDEPDEVESDSEAEIVHSFF